ncbi:MAG: hypothetical protein HC895_01330 [Leptolyngbyaceae cyanobacterium SM1_3_5]|nr:hypothetical protein [Leptolyngbyaceae cyanobacterium SM1_3_5]
MKRLSENPKGIQVKDLVFRRRSDIEAAQAAGYSLEDVVKEFEAVGVSLTLNTLKQYLREVRAIPDPPPDAESAPPKRATASTRKNQTTPSPSSPEPPPIANSEPSASAIASEDEAQNDDRTSKPRLTNTNEAGFQEMLSNDEL